MKLFKKTAALLFCLALVFSVMAISASADGDPTFTLTLEQSTFTDLDGITGLEVHQNSSVAYDIKLASNTANQNVSSLSFTITPISGVNVDVKFGASGNVNPLTSGNTYSYSAAANGNDTDFALTTADTAVKVGTVTFTFTSDANHQTVNPTLSDINLSRRVEDDKSYSVSPVGVTLQVNPIYAITLTRYQKNPTNGVKEAYTGSAATTLYYDFDHTIYSDNAGTTGASLTAADTLAAYTYNGWKIKEKGTGTWGDVGTVVSPMDSLGNDTVGTVTLEADYTAIQYKFSVKNNDGDTNVDSTGMYTVESLASDETNAAAASPLVTLVASAPTWTGYNFKGWKVEHDTSVNNVGYNNAVWKAYTDTDYVATSEDNTNLVAQDAWLGTNAYGDVILTAIWDEAGEFATAVYAYANNADVLILYAVPSGEGVYSSADTYKYNDNNMFIVPATKAATYLSKFTTDQQTAVGSNYVMYAYIATSTGAAKNLVTIAKENTGTNDNVPLTYDGNVYRDNTLDTADYGNVDYLLKTRSSEASELTATQIRTRLEADVVNNGATIGESTVSDETNYGSIWDIKAIIAKFGNA